MNNELNLQKTAIHSTNCPRLIRSIRCCTLRKRVKYLIRPNADGQHEGWERRFIYSGLENTSAISRVLRARHVFWLMLFE